MPHPPAPWQMYGDLWLSLYRVNDVPGRPPGVVGVAWVRYREPSPLTYHELLVARPRPDEPGRPVTISDIWVDSADSRDGGRALWAIPKDLCDFSMESSRTGPLRRTTWEASVGGQPIASARFTDVSAATVPLPFRGSTLQEWAGGGVARATLQGRARTLPARAAMDFAEDGPLGWLAGRRALASVAISDFEMTFG